MVVVDRLSKIAHFIACKKIEDAASVAELYLREVKTLWKLLKTKLLFSTSHHPQTDGQTEVTNKTLGRILRFLVSKTLKDYDPKIAAAEFAFNRATSTATGHSPYEVVNRVNPLMPLDLSSVPREELNSDAKKTAELLGSYTHRKSKLDAKDVGSPMPKESDEVIVEEISPNAKESDAVSKEVDAPKDNEKEIVKDMEDAPPKELQESVRKQIERSNELYKKQSKRPRKKKEFKAGDLVWLHLRKERFP
ncbi:uncharacterized protein LOC141601342 [Silene latifolia]|uniref:uncharacterized protein LOC141601342 n=1 Tax=Silene latifolia TaxID=37657 RepID=UPI003D77DD50